MWTVNPFPGSFKGGMHSTDGVSLAKMAWEARMGPKVIGVLEKDADIQHLQDTHIIDQRAPRSFVKDAAGGLVGRWTADARCTGD
ncbi:hypothetical protein CH63R_09716 [Colletotrichum higginsianum IMI 349063]|uniref:Uncharacterized protein n=1 Tax=Colletotrichum higginsianum (strain IMI 349063) TaxID=759273 RepID=A0A1B7Y0Q7_COLHI|nr:uncharacterized protein CH63R_09716 [Colletotrichum higginsianum IMI 349063]OBR05596.1 hypothetical protein CH63R_09716 [Colletotrichum higginsianum IMI 349063]